MTIAPTLAKLEPVIVAHAIVVILRPINGGRCIVLGGGKFVSDKPHGKVNEHQGSENISGPNGWKSML